MAYKNKNLVKLIADILITIALSSGSIGLLGKIAYAQSQPTQTQDLYQQAKQDLPENYYIIYRIVDQIARANGLDDLPWRIQLTSQNNVNASASEYNMLTFEGGIFEQLQGNSSAVACVVAHEMAHHKKQHLGFGPAQQIEAAAKAKIEAENQKTEVRDSARSTQDSGTALSILTQIGGNYADAPGKGALDTAGRAIQQNTQADPNAIAQQEAEIDRATEEKIKQEIMAINHRQEFEADELGYIYSTTAGFKPEGCLKAMEVLGRGYGAEVNTDSHPAVSERLKKLEALMQQNPPEQLQQQGKARLATAPTPLPYENFSYKAADGATVSGIKLAPKTGSTLNDLDSTLGK